MFNIRGLVKFGRFSVEKFSLTSWWSSLDVKNICLWNNQLGVRNGNIYKYVNEAKYLVYDVSILAPY